MNLQAIITAAADEADTLLEGITTAAEARPVILEWLTDHHASLSAPDRQKAMQGIVALLEREGFFAVGGRGGAGAEGGDAVDD